MASSRAAARKARPALSERRVADAFNRLARERAFHSLVQGALPAQTLRRLLRDALPRKAAREMPAEVWASLAMGIALESPEFGLPLADALHDRLAWDREPDDMDEWWRAVRERPLEALWMAALSETKAVRKEFPHVAQHCLENFRSSPECAPPSWEYVEGLLDVQAQTSLDLRDAERDADDAERKYDAERERLEELREELRRLRRELADLRSEKAQAERRADELAERARLQLPPDAARRVEELERRARKAEKETEHLVREVERLRAAARAALPGEAEAAPALDLGGASLAQESAVEGAAETPDGSIAADPSPRRRVLRQMLRKLVKKGKIGASHTHEDNVYRGVADHEKGIAKEAMDLLYREGFLVPKPTTTDPHVSISPERVAEVHAIVAGEIRNPRLQRFAEGG